MISTTNYLVRPRGVSKSYLSTTSDINENSHESPPGILSEDCRIELGLSEEDVKEKGRALEEVISEVSFFAVNL